MRKSTFTIKIPEIQTIDDKTNSENEAKSSTPLIQKNNSSSNLSTTSDQGLDDASSTSSLFSPQKKFFNLFDSGKDSSSLLPSPRTPRSSIVQKVCFFFHFSFSFLFFFFETF